MAGFTHEPQMAEVVDISGDARSWSEVCPDEYMSLEYVGPQQLTLHIIAVRQEKIGDKLKAVLRFSNNPRGLVLNKTNRDILGKMFGDSPSAAIGKTITLRMGFVNKNPALTIYPPSAPTNGAATAAQAPAAGSTPQVQITPEMLAMFQQMQQAGQLPGAKPA